MEGDGLGDGLGDIIGDGVGDGKGLGNGLGKGDGEAKGKGLGEGKGNLRKGHRGLCRCTQCNRSIVSKLEKILPLLLFNVRSN
jgi:hypothetical protein